MVSFVWFYFQKLSKESGKCMRCHKVIRISGSSTTNLIKHLKFKHDIVQDRQEEPITNIVSDSSKQLVNGSKINNLDNLVKKPMEYYLSRMAAVEGFTINQIVKSFSLQEFLFTKGYQVPKSNTTVMSMVLNYSNLCKRNLAKKISELKNEELDSA